MIWWIAGAYVAIVLFAFLGMVRHMEPLDGRAWFTVLLLAVFWPASLIWFVIP